MTIVITMGVNMMVSTAQASGVGGT